MVTERWVKQDTEAEGRVREEDSTMVGSGQETAVDY
jgi:hypothetical protein